MKQLQLASAEQSRNFYAVKSTVITVALSALVLWILGSFVKDLNSDIAVLETETEGTKYTTAVERIIFDLAGLQSSSSEQVASFTKKTQEDVARFDLLVPQLNAAFGSAVAKQADDLSVEIRAAIRKGTSSSLILAASDSQRFVNVIARNSSLILDSGTDTYFLQDATISSTPTLVQCLMKLNEAAGGATLSPKGQRDLGEAEACVKSASEDLLMNIDTSATTNSDLVVHLRLPKQRVSSALNQVIAEVEKPAPSATKLFEGAKEIRLASGSLFELTSSSLYRLLKARHQHLVSKRRWLIIDVSVFLLFLIYLKFALARETVGQYSRLNEQIASEAIELERAVHDLEANKAKVALATQATGLGIWEIDLESGTARADDQVHKIYGMDPSRQDKFDLKRWSEVVIPEDLHLLQTDLSVLGQSKSREYRIVRPNDGQVRIIQTIETERIDPKTKRRTLVGTALDVTELRQAAQMLEESESRFRLLVERAPIAIGLVQSGQLSYVNSTFCTMFGYAEQQMPGDLSQTQISSVVAAEEGFLDLKREHFHEAVGKRRDGSTFPVALMVTAVELRNGHSDVVFVTDLTESKQFEAERIARGVAEQASRSKSEFLSRMSHELRTPLNAILGYSQIFELQYTDPTIREFASSIRVAGQHLLTLINEVLDLARIESGTLRISREPVLLATALEDSVQLVSPLADQRKVSIVVTPTDEPMWVMADRQRLTQVLVNLINNAVKYNRQGGTVTISPAISDNQTINIVLSDSGLGLDPEKLAKLYEPFERGSNHSEEGTGLGLVVSKELVELMGGSLELVSTGPDGTTFQISLEGTSSPLTAAPISQGAHIPVPTVNQRVLQVVYVEDNMSNRDLLVSFAAMTGNLDLIHAWTGQEGLQCITEVIPDLVLLDLHLPDMTGQDLLRELQLNPLTSKIPVIVLSADASERVIKELLSSGAKQYITKPIDLRVLQAAIEGVRASHLT